jgi:3-hydroxybutyryl-CoA dehydrogenase
MAEPLTVGVVGAGAMGAGIAQVAAQAGHQVLLADARPDGPAKAVAGMRAAFDRLVAKGRMTADEAARVVDRVTPVPPAGGAVDLRAFSRCGLVIEAIVEDLAAKRELFARLDAVVGPEASLATNTSSLSVAAIASATTRPERVLGLHFFNPAPLMALVEVIPGVRTAPEAADRAHALMAAWGKVPVRALDTPGFIVNRVARPFYGEALRLLEERTADPATIDWAMTTLGGFRMGPCELIDFIGHDVNFAVTKSVWEQTFHEPRYRPSLIQQRLVEAGMLGRKAGRGFYDHAEGAARPAPAQDAALGETVLHRIVAMLVNEACDAVFTGVCTAADVELAMTRGVNYPRGLLAWGDALGPSRLVAWLRGWQEELGAERYRPSPYLVRRAREGRSLLA